MHTLVFTYLQYKSFENTMGKGELTRYEQFLLFPLCFLLPFGGVSAFFFEFKIVVCKLLQDRKNINFVIWERVECI